MDRRLVPVNGVIALLRDEAGWPSALAGQGFRLHALEADVQSSPGVVRADAIFYRRDPDLIVLCECKSGRHVQARQARSYLTADFAGLRQRGTAPAVFRQPVPVVALFAGLEEDRNALAESLMREELVAPLLTIGAEGAGLTGSTSPGLHDFDERDPRHGFPPMRLRVDQESPREELTELLVQQIGAALARGDQVLDLTLAAGAMLPDWGTIGVPTRRRFVDRLAEAGRVLARGPMRGDVQVESGNNIAPRLALLARPAATDPRGMPQAYQSVARRAGGALGRERRPPSEGQLDLSLDDLDRESGGA